MHLRVALLQSAHEIHEVLERQIGVQATDDVELRHRLRETLTRSLPSLFQRHRVSARRVLLATKSAQPACRHAYVRGIDMAVDVEISLIAMHALAHRIGHPSHG